MTYSVKEILHTLQGEGARSGRSAVFLRFAGCNLWTGREEDRHKAVCRFCDTQFVGTDGENGGKFKYPMYLAAKARQIWDEGTGVSDGGKPYLVASGGEPLLQLDEALIRCLHQQGFEIAVETNGTIKAPAGIDWICVSPKANSKIVQTWGNELKLVYPQEGNKPEDFQYLAFDHFFISPKDGSFDNTETELNRRLAIEYVYTHPQWRLSIQSHKILGLQ